VNGLKPRRLFSANFIFSFEAFFCQPVYHFFALRGNFSSVGYIFQGDDMLQLPRNSWPASFASLSSIAES
jgi:hypothetical protein